MTDPSVPERRQKARQLGRSGRIGEAIALLRDLVEDPQVPPNRDDHALLGLYHFNLGQPLEAARIMIDCHRRWPDDLEILKNIGVCLSRGGENAEAKPWLLQAVERDPEDANLHDALANVLGRLDEREAALTHGERALLLKDQVAAAGPVPFDPRPLPIADFDESRPARNVIAFSLWGQAERYTEGALANARLAPHIYPGWRCRFYVEATVSERIVGELLANGADVIRMPAQQAKSLRGSFLALSGGLRSRLSTVFSFATPIPSSRLREQPAPLIAWLRKRRAFPCHARPRKAIPI